MANNAVIGILRVILGLDSAQFESGTKRATDSARVFERQMRATGAQLTGIGQTLTLGVTAPLVAFAATSARAAIGFESSFAGIVKTVDDATDSTGKLTNIGRQLQQQMRDMAKVIPVNVNELNKVGEAAGQLGIKTQNIAGFTEVMAKLGVTTNLTSEEAATMLARFDNITTGGAQETFEEMGAAIVELGNNLATTERELLEMAMRLAGAGRQIGLTQADILSLGGALSSMGLEAEAGGTAFSRVMIEMQNAVLDGGKSLQVFTDVAGEDFAKVFREDAAQAINNFIAGLARMSEEGKNINPVLDQLGLGGIRVSDALRRTGNAVERLSGALETGRRGFSEMSALNEEAQKRFATTESRLTLLWQRIKDVGITIGNALLPTINALIGGFDKLIPVLDVIAKGFESMPTAVQAVAIGFLALVAAIGPLLFVSGQLAFAASSIAAAFTRKGVATRVLTALMPNLTRVTLAQAAADRTAAVAAGQSAAAMGTQAVAATAAGGAATTTAGRMAVLWASFRTGGAVVARMAASLLGLTNPVGMVRAALIALSLVIPQVRGMLGDFTSILVSMSRVMLEIGRFTVASMMGALKQFGTWLVEHIPLMDRVNAALNAMQRRVSEAAEKWRNLADAMRDARDSEPVASLGAQDRTAALQQRVNNLISPPIPALQRQAAALVTERDTRNTQAAAAAVQTLVQRYAELQVAVQRLTPAQIAQIEAGQQLGLSAAAIADELGKLGVEYRVGEDVVRAYLSASRETASALSATADALVEVRRELLANRSLLSSGFGPDVPGAAFIEQAHQLSAFAAGTPLDLSQIIWPEEADARLAEAGRDMEGLYARLKADADEAAREVEQQRQATEQAWLESISAIVAGFQRLAGSGVGAFAQIAHAGAIAAEAMLLMTTNQRALGQEAFARGNLGGGRNAAMGAGMLGLAGMQAFGSLQGFQAATTTGDSRGGRAGRGALIGGQAGLAFGPYGALVGAGFGALAGATNDPAVQGRQQARAGLAGLAQLFEQVANSAQRAEAETATLMARTEGGPVGAWQRSWILVRDAYLETGQTADRALADFEALKEAAEEGPEAVAAAMAQINEILSRREQLLDAQRQKQELLNEAVARWGFSFEEAGRGFQRAALAEHAEQFIQDWQLLIESGIDPTELAKRMSGSVQEFIDAAIRTGAEVPEAMRPMLQEMADLGLLIGANGQAFMRLEDSGLTFGRALENMFEGVLEALNRLIEALTRPLPESGFMARRPTPLAVYTGSGAAERRVEAFGTGGIVKGIKGMAVPIVAHAGEGVVNPMGMKALGVHGLEMLNAGKVPDMFSGMGAALDAVRSQTFTTRHSEVLGGSITAGGSGLTTREGEIHLTLGPGSVVVHGAGMRPEQVADAIVVQLPRAIARNRGGIRTTLRRQVGRR